MFVSDSDLKKAVSLLDDFKNKRLDPNVTEEQLWQAQKIKQATIHPDTNEKIFMPFRMSGYVPFNSPIVAGMLMKNPTTAQIVFWQWINQSHNACVNFANRNATKPTSMKTILTGYTSAVTSAVSISVGLHLLLQKANTLKPLIKNLLQRLLPLPALMTASTMNVVLMRINELDEGIEVLDKDNKVVGTSKLAAKKALQETAITRCLLPIPLLTIPNIVMSGLERTKMLKANPKLYMPINLFICTVSFLFALPATIAVFPQMSKVEVSELEPELREKANDKFVYYNKGL